MIVRYRFAMQMKGIHPLNVTVRFGHPFLVTLYTSALLMIGWAIGAHWSHTFAAGWMLLLATILLLLHDAAVAILRCASRNCKPSTSPSGGIFNRLKCGILNRR